MQEKFIEMLEELTKMQQEFVVKTYILLEKLYYI